MYCIYIYIQYIHTFCCHWQKNTFGVSIKIYKLGGDKMESIMIECNHIHKSFGSFSLKDITFTFPAGYILGVVGANGSGKTTLLHILLGLYKADSGELHIFDNDYQDKETVIREEIGLVLQDDLFYEHLNLYDNACHFGKRYSKFDKNKLSEYCRRFSLDEKKRYCKLSKGEKLKFQFAFALSHHPKLLILDEATGNFDLEFRTEFQKLMTEFIQDGKHSIIFSSHVFNEMERIADYILFMDKGEVVLYKDRESIIQEYRMIIGEQYKINRLSSQNVIYKEGTKEEMKALVRYSKFDTYDKELTVKNVTISDFIYYYMAAKKSN